MSTPLRIQPAPEPVRLTARLDSNGELQLYHQNQPLSQNDFGLEIVLGSTSPVTLEITDFHDTAGNQWIMTATGGTWTRTETATRSQWNETPSEVQVEVQANNAAGVSKRRPIFVKVQPSSIKPWP